MQKYEGFANAEVKSGKEQKKKQLKKTTPQHYCIVNVDNFLPQ